MTFDWKQYYEIAKFLHGDILIELPNEASLRSSVSRAYYSAFCLARNFAIIHRHFEPFHDDRDHKNLIENFRVGKFSQVAARLQRLREWRNASDYQDEIENLELMCNAAIEATAKILNAIK
jgi:uncharacterized protein (UPF0332 family)